MTSASSPALAPTKSKITNFLLHPYFAISVVFALLWNVPAPEGLTLQAWRLFAIFVATIMGLITKPLPMGAVAIVAVAVSLATKTLSIEQALSSFNSKIVWLIFSAFLLAKGFIKTGLGARIAYHFVSLLGKNTIGLSYGLITTELLLAPLTPSNTARGAGIIFPIITSLSKEYGSNSNDASRKKIGAYLIALCYQVNVITSAMFLTAMAGNPMILEPASKLGLNVDWMLWAKACIVPGLANLIILPWIVYWLYKPEITDTPEAPEFARNKLKLLGPMKHSEWTMLSTFALLLFMWMGAEKLAIDPAAAALIGLSILMVTKVLSFEDILNEHNAWHTFLWLAVLLMLSEHLNKFGMSNWFSTHLGGSIAGFSWPLTLTIVLLIYFYSHYMFASMSAHIGSMLLPLALVACQAGTPPGLAVMLFLVSSSLCAGITHYGTGTAPVYFGSNYVTTKEWWYVGGATSVFNLLIWSLVGGAWWKFLGIW